METFIGVAETAGKVLRVGVGVRDVKVWVGMGEGETCAMGVFVTGVVVLWQEGRNSIMPIHMRFWSVRRFIAG